MKGIVALERRQPCDNNALRGDTTSASLSPAGSLISEEDTRTSKANSVGTPTS
ncbi:unnamed protein product [Heligmosomoides polygyrus]|uniref:Uncharacterized protein n=1 Tax=Heligmosomoides polygyrus TaxID=6339 RepID=A0A183F8W9_HELPZ|nr:unnamed protein product [Heligmosomoides polygyrus]